MKKIFLIGIAVLLLTGCGGKESSLTCSGGTGYPEMKGKSTRYFYFYNNKISKVNIEMELDEQKDADYICNDYKNIKSSHENETKDMKITCDGRKVSVENLYIDYYKDLKDASREDVIKLAKESYDIKCE